MLKQKIKKVIIVNQLGSGSSYCVGENGVTDIKKGTNQISNDEFVHVIQVLNGKHLIEEISMATPYVITYFDKE